MAATSAQTDHHRAGATTDRPRGVKHRRPLLNHLHVQVPVSAGHGWLGRPTGPTSAPAGAHADRPASPSLLRSPTAWIRAKGHISFASSSKHAPGRRTANFHYDASSYARNFDEGDGDDDLDALRHRCFSPRLPTSPPRPASPSGLRPSAGKQDLT
ncbi:hypothetical protein ACP70R_032863 [Stipagrostis hirtigluma subsp. patula]